MEKNKQEIQQRTFKTHILLPFIFIITIAVAIMFIAVKDFIVDLSPFIVWLYFGVVLAYVAVAILDLIVNKERGKKQKIFIVIMSVLAIIASILYATFYLIAKSK